MEWAGTLIDHIDTAVNYINDMAAITPTLKALGVRCAQYKADKVHIDALESCLIELMSKELGSSWTGRLQAAWAVGFEACMAVFMPAFEQAKRETAIINLVSCRPRPAHAHIHIQLASLFLLPVLMNCLVYPLCRCKSAGSEWHRTRRLTVQRCSSSSLSSIPTFSRRFLSEVRILIGPHVHSSCLHAHTHAVKT